MSLTDDEIAATAAHKHAMAVHAVMASVADFTNVTVWDNLSDQDLVDLEYSHRILGRHLQALRIRRAA